MVKMDSRRLTYVCGFLGSGIIVLGSLLAAIPYRGKGGESYSILNHFISELGEVGVSRLAPVFNASLIVGGVVLLIFALGLGLYIRTKRGYLATAFGILSCLSCSLLGVFPTNYLSVHDALADSFFYNGLIATTLFTLGIIFDKENKVSKWLAVPAAITVACFFSFLVVPEAASLTRVQTLDLDHFTRPDIWPTTILEWSVFISGIAWFVLTSTYLMAKRRARVTKKGSAKVV
jgi:hypothetical membrane protein